MRVFWRERGVVAYEAPVERDHESLSALVEELLASGLAWVWESGRDDPVAPEWAHLELPKDRPATPLTRESATSLLADLLELNVEGYARSVLLFGADPGAAGILLDDTPRREAVRRFCADEAGPVRAVRYQIGDQANHLVFVPHEPVSSVVALLERWLPERAEARRYKYSQLYVARLEVAMGLVKP